MDDVKRWHMGAAYNARLDNAGYWVRHSDYAALQARLAEVETERDDADSLAHAAFADGASNNIRLAEATHRTKEAVETLRKGFKSCDPTKTAAAIVLAIAQLEDLGCLL